MKTHEVADILGRYLKSKGFVVQRYDSYSSKSIYLKLDYGVCNSIRISDHRGKKHLSYKYNIGSNIMKCRVENGRHTRFYYPMDQGNELIKKIIKHKNRKLEKYGQANYKRYMERSRRENAANQGFWQKAVEL